MKHAALTSLLVCLAFGMTVAGWAEPAPNVAATPEQVAKVQAILDAHTEPLARTVGLVPISEDALVAMEEVLVKEGPAILPALEASPVVDTGQPDVSPLVQRQAKGIREVIARLTWGVNPRDMVQQAFDARAQAAQREPRFMFPVAPALITDPQVTRAFPQCLFYVARITLPFDTYSSMRGGRPLLLVLQHTDGVNDAVADPAALKVTWITTPGELETFFTANAKALSNPLPQVAGVSITRGRTFDEVYDATYSWVRLYAALVHDNRLIVDPNITAQVGTVFPIADGAPARIQIIGVLSATSQPNKLTGNFLTGTLDVTAAYNAENGKLESIFMVDKLRPVTML